ncbi:Ig-like domain-containing protein [Variovorax robiniae]|uniref:Ig-like domain-containing protein n=1 Tax=Variovorax robiniae TaxID=1836199 RepID=A0ABU8XCS4_9BURK
MAQKEAADAPLAEGADADVKVAAVSDGSAATEEGKALASTDDGSAAATATGQDNYLNALYALPLLLLGAAGGGGGGGGGGAALPLVLSGAGGGGTPAKPLSAPTVTLAQDTGTSASDGITSNAALTLSAAPAGGIRYFVVDGGQPSLTYVAPLLDGSHTVQVIDIDAAGNSSTSTTLSFHLDRMAPGATSVALTSDTGVDGDRITSNGAISVGGIEPGAKVQYSIDGGASYSSDFTPVEGVNTVLVRQLDLAGNAGVATQLTFTLDTQAPSAPAVSLVSDTGVAGDGITRNGHLNVTGVESGARLQFSVDGGTTWSDNFSAVEGSNTVMVRQIDAAGNIGNASTSLDFTLDTTLATPTIALTNDTGASASDRITTDASLTLSEVPADATRTFTVDGGAASASYEAPTTWGLHTVVVTDTDAAGNVRSSSLTFTLGIALPTPTIALTNDTGESTSDLITSDASLTLSEVPADATRTFTVDGGAASASYVAPTDDGAHTVVVTDTDAAGNVTTASLTFTLDTTLDTPTIALADDTGASTSDRITSDASLTFSEVPADATRTFTVDGGAASASYVAPTSDGSHTVVVTDTDAAGNVRSTSLTFTLDQTATLSSAEIACASDDMAPVIDTVARGGVTNDSTITLDGTVNADFAAGDQIIIYDGAVPIGFATVNGDTWTFTTPALATEGLHSFTTAVVDSAGNVGPLSAEYSIVLDTIAPADPAAPVLDAASDLGFSASDNLTSDDTPAIHVTATLNDGETLYLYQDGVALAVASFTIPDGQSGPYLLDTCYTPASSLADGSYTFSTQVVDAAGNASAVVAGAPVVIDTVISTSLACITSVTDDVALQTGIVPDGGATNDNVLQLDGAIDAPLQAGERVAIYDGGTFLGYAAAGTGATAWTYTTPALAGEGTHSFTVNIVRDSGALGDYSDPYFVVLDTIAPANPAAPVLDAASDLGFSASDNLTSDDTPTIHVTATLNDGETLYLYQDGVAMAVACFTIPDGQSGPYLLETCYTPATGLADGSYTFSTQVVDAAGNASALIHGTPIVIDTAISTTLASITDASDDTGIFTGSVGYHTTEQPPFAHQGVTNDTTLALSGTTDAPLAPVEQVAIYDGSAFLGYATAGPACTWTYVADLSGDGTHAFTAVVTRDSGASGDVSDTLQVVLKTTTPEVSLDFHTGTGGSVIDVSGFDIHTLVDAQSGTATLDSFHLAGFNAAAITTNEVLAISGNFTGLDSAATVASDVNTELTANAGSFTSGANLVLLLQDLANPAESKVWRYQDGSNGGDADGMIQAGELTLLGEMTFAGGSSLESLLAENFKLQA